MKRLAFAAITVVLILGSLAPAASASVEPSVLFQGLGAGRALDLAAPLLRVLPAGVVDKLVKGITVGFTSSTFNGLSNSKATGAAVGDCSLIAAGVSLPALGNLPCSGDAMETSASDGDNGDGNQTCRSALSLAIVDLVTSCANSVSRLEGVRPLSQNSGGVAEVNVGLDLNLLKLLGLDISAQDTLDQVVAPVLGLVKGVLGTVPAVGELTPSQTSSLTDQITGLLNQIAGSAGKLATVRAGLASTDVTNAGVVTTVTSQAVGAEIGLLGLTDALKDGLIMIKVGAARATASWNDAAAVAEASATPAVATIKVRDLLNLTGSPDGYITANVEAPALQNVLNLLAGTPLESTIELASATAPQRGPSVAASTTGVGLHLLKGLGASSLGAKDGGLLLRLAAANVSMSGDVVKAEVVQPPLAVTGGPVYAFLGGAAVLAAGAPVVYAVARRIRRKAA